MNKINFHTGKWEKKSIVANQPRFLLLLFPSLCSVISIKLELSEHLFSLSSYFMTVAKWSFAASLSSQPPPPHQWTYKSVFSSHMGKISLFTGPTWQFVNSFLLYFLNHFNFLCICHISYPFVFPTAKNSEFNLINSPYLNWYF